MINLVAEIGINHNGDLEVARKLITLSAIAGFNYVKFQKRNPDICVPDDKKDLPRATPWGEMTYLKYKKKIEFNYREYEKINSICKLHKIKWFSSVWDLDSAGFMAEFCDTVKIPSALITDIDLLAFCRLKYKTVIMSTGMSSEEEIEQAVKVGNPDVLLHSVAEYPTKIENLNLNYIHWLQNKYPTKQIGYSGHDDGIYNTILPIYAGITWIEKHITLDKNLWGSDHKSSLNPAEMFSMVEKVRDAEKALGFYGSRVILECEKEKREMLRK